MVHTCGDPDVAGLTWGLGGDISMSDSDNTQAWNSLLKWRHCRENNMWPNGRDWKGDFIPCLGVL